MSEIRNINEETRIQELFADIEAYKQAIENAEGALDAAEQKLDEAVAAEFEKQLS